MTNKEYIEKNNISFSDAMKMYDNEKYPCINDWLSQEHQEHRFKVGDFVIDLCNPIGIGLVIDVKDKVYFKCLRRNGVFCFWNGRNGNYGKYENIPPDSRMYHRNEHEVYTMEDESTFKKIF